MVNTQRITSASNKEEFFFGLGLTLFELLIAAPIILVVLVALGILQLALITSTLLNIQIILISVLLVISGLIYARMKRKVVRVDSIPWAIALGFLYWLYKIYIATQTTYSWLCNIPILGTIVCGLGILISIPSLIADVLAFIIWVALTKLIVKLLVKR